jgi:hypothetical protein
VPKLGCVFSTSLLSILGKTEEPALWLCFSSNPKDLAAASRSGAG